MHNRVTAALEVLARIAVEVDWLDVDDLTADEIAAALEQTTEPYLGLCCECAHYVRDPQVGELAGFTVDGLDYVKHEGTGHWVEAGTEMPMPEVQRSIPTASTGGR